MRRWPHGHCRGLRRLSSTKCLLNGFLAGRKCDPVKPRGDFLPCPLFCGEGDVAIGADEPQSAGMQRRPYVGVEQSAIFLQQRECAVVVIGKESEAWSIAFADGRSTFADGSAFAFGGSSADVMAFSVEGLCG